MISPPMPSPPGVGTSVPGRQAASVHALTEATRLLGRGIEVLPEDEWELRFDQSHRLSENGLLEHR
jgi:hypothetical protein